MSVICGVHKSGRGAQVPVFGPDITQSFCEREGIQMIVRSHQFVAEGAKFMHSGRLVTLFSARNYLGEDTNDGACLLVTITDDNCLRVRAKRLLVMET